MATLSAWGALKVAMTGRVHRAHAAMVAMTAWGAVMVAMRPTTWDA